MRTSGFTLILLSLSLSMLACDQPATGPAVEGVPQLATDAATDQPSDVLVTGGRASGHVAVQGINVGVQDQRYSFTAISAGAFPSAKGQVEVHYVRLTGEEIRVHADVTCLSIEGNQAWIGSQTTRYISNGEEVPERTGIPMVFRVVDLGERENATELASLVLFHLVPDGQDIAHCTSRIDFPILRTSTTGNIQVNAE
jgi:hypothetical protein